MLDHLYPSLLIGLLAIAPAAASDPPAQDSAAPEYVSASEREMAERAYREEMAARVHAEERIEKERVRARFEELIRYNGDLASIAKSYRAMHTLILETIKAQGIEPPAGLLTELDRLFSPEQLETALARDFSRLIHIYDGLIDPVEKWGSDPEMQALNRMIRDFEPQAAGSGEDPPDVDRIGRLLRLEQVLNLREQYQMAMRTQIELVAPVLDSMDPDAAQGQAMLDALDYGMRAPTEEAIVSSVLAPALASATDAQLDRFLAFAESKAGNHYFGTYLLSYSMEKTDAWLQSYLAAVQRHPLSQPDAPTSGGTAAMEVDAIVQELSELLDRPTSRDQDLAARRWLNQAQQQSPNDARIPLLLGRIAMNQREGYIPDVDELRQTADSPPVELVQFDEAEQHYLRAIELDPKLADAHVRLGYARFLQSLDKQARESYDLAKKFDPEHPMLALRYAQLEHVEGHYEKAIEGYLAVIAKPERTSGVHRRALVHSRLAFIEQGKLDDYLSLGERYLASNPDQHQYRVDLARHLLWSGATADHVLKVLDLAPAHWGPVRVIRGVSLVLKVWEVQRASGQIDAQARTWLEEAVALYGNVLSLASEMCMSPSGASAATLLVPLSNQPHDVLSQVLGCAIRHGDLDAIVAAKRLGADLDEILATWIPETPLGMAALMRKPDVFKKLLELGADPSRPMRDGRTLDEFLIQASIPPDPYPDAKHLREMLTRFQHERGAGSTE